MHLSNYPCSTCRKPRPAIFYIIGGRVLCTCADCYIQQAIDKMTFTDDDFDNIHNEPLHANKQEEYDLNPQTS